MEQSGKWLILAILAIALILGGFSWWFRWSVTHRAAALWGPNAAATIRDAKRVIAIRLLDYDPAQVQHSQLADPPKELVVVSIDASQAHGLVHLKQALLDDRSFAWDQPAETERFVARWVLQFSKPARESETDVSVLLDDACARCRFVVGGKWSPIVNCEPMSAGLKTLFADWFATEGCRNANPF